jgi:hypothetical protein
MVVIFSIRSDSWVSNAVMPVVRRHIKGPMWMHFFVGVSYTFSFIIHTLAVSCGPVQHGPF